MNEKTFLIKEEEISHISHELRNPLAAIQLYSELLESGPDPLTDKQQTILKEIIISNQRVLEIIDEFRKKYQS